VRARGARAKSSRHQFAWSIVEKNLGGGIDKNFGLQQICCAPSSINTPLQRQHDRMLCNLQAGG
jgi:hypothetical protein